MSEDVESEDWLELLDRNWLQRFRRNLPKWYEKHGRKLPWRESQNAYAIWVSEIMLQQTTVAAVIPYFDRFLERFPTVDDLATAEEAEVLRLWEGLGYYSRARNLHKTAGQIVSEYDSEFPETVDELLEFPGIGRYTAGAVVSFAFDKPAPILEANTIRLYARLLGYLGQPRSTAGQKLLWSFAERILPRKSPGLFNQALMELGSKVCTVNDPDCANCPVKSCCQAFAEGLQAEIPVPATKMEITEVTEVTIAVQHEERFLVRQRGSEERWAGMWDFPRFEVSTEWLSIAEQEQGVVWSASLHRHLEGEFLTLTGVEIQMGEQVTVLKHGVTRFRITLHCFHAKCKQPPEELSSHLKWVTRTEFEEIPFPTTGRRFASLLQQQPPPRLF